MAMCTRLLSCAVPLVATGLNFASLSTGRATAHTLSVGNEHACVVTTTGGLKESDSHDHCYRRGQIIDAKSRTFSFHLGFQFGVLVAFLARSDVLVMLK